MATAEDPDPLSLTPQDVARLTGLAVSTVQMLSDRGDIRCFRVPGKGSHTIRRFRRSWVDEFVKANTTELASSSQK